MFTPDNYYAEYKKISRIISDKIIFILALTYTLLMFTLFNNYNNQSTSLNVVFKYFLLAIIILFVLKYFMNRFKYKKLISLTNDNAINAHNYRYKLNCYILKELDAVLSANNINKDIYDKFYRDQLVTFSKNSKSILGEHAYISFILGSLFVAFLQGTFNIQNTFQGILGTFYALFIFSVFIIIVIFQFKQDRITKYNDICDLIFFTECVFSKQNKD